MSATLLREIHLQHVASVEKLLLREGLPVDDELHPASLDLRRKPRTRLQLLYPRADVLQRRLRLRLRMLRKVGVHTANHLLDAPPLARPHLLRLLPPHRVPAEDVPHVPDAHLLEVVVEQPQLKMPFAKQFRDLRLRDPRDVRETLRRKSFERVALQHPPVAHERHPVAAETLRTPLFAEESPPCLPSFPWLYTDRVFASAIEDRGR
ncbi:MAG: hypothetical protein EOM17_09635 [Synergistales bacterium]|nr:hypothetical protein [Synergistales bacterium]